MNGQLIGEAERGCGKFVMMTANIKISCGDFVGEKEYFCKDCIKKQKELKTQLGGINESNKS